MIIPTRSEILQKAAEGSLFDALFEDYGRHWFEADDPTILLLANLHNEGAIDLLALVTSEALQPHAGHNFFRGQHLYQALITKLDASVESLMNAVQTLRRAAGHDGAAGLPLEEFAKWCAADAKRPAELLALIDADVPDADQFLIIAIKSGVLVDPLNFTNRAYQFLDTGTPAQRIGAINALGQIAVPTDADWNRLIGAFSSTLAPDPGDLVRSALLMAVARRLEGTPPHWVAALEAIATGAVAERGQYTLYEAARTLAFSFDSLPASLVETLLGSLSAVRAIDNGTIDLLDFALMKLVEKGAPQRARSFLEDMLTKGEGAPELKQFDSLMHNLVETGGKTLEDWVVAWLRLGVYDVCQQMNHAMFGASAEGVPLTIDFGRFGLMGSEHGYLARKAIATFFLKPLIMASILTSLLRSAPAGCAVDIEALLFDPVLMNYSGIAAGYLEPVAEDGTDRAAPAVARALKRLEHYIEGLKSIGSVRELHPSARERQLEWERHSDAMNGAMRAARKKSIFAQIATESVMLHGNRAVTWVDHPAEPLRRMETELASIGTSFEMPRIDTVDPLGLQLMLLRFRGERPPR